ncbi:MAG: M4 family metallopeptidase [Ilyomonas sp.]
MCNNQKHHHSVFCFLPPYLLHNIANSPQSSPRLRSLALNAMGVDITFRSLRMNSIARRDPGRKWTTLFSTTGNKQRTIYSAGNKETFPGVVVRTEGSAESGDPAVDEAYNGLGDTYDFYWEVFKRNSIDDEGLPLNAVVHYGENYDNAFWDGQRMVFGDGDNELFNRFTKSIDVIGHELTHGVTEDEAQLVYTSESGALNESISDVFGSLIKQYSLKQTADKADWLIGAELLTDAVKNDKTSGPNVAIRSMKDPGSAYDHPVLGKDPQPKNMKDYVNTMQDNGGVHINSGIPNFAFYNAAINIGGNAWEKTGRIWYETLLDPKLKPNAKFQSFAQLTVANAKNYNAEKEIGDAWDKVGISIP